MFDFLSTLIDTDGFPQRWECGVAWQQNPALGWIHICSDLATFAAYTLIPCVLGYFLYRRRDLTYPSVFLLFCIFIFACGTVHLLEALIFWWPAYRLSAVFKVITAAASWGTVTMMAVTVPHALKLRSPEQLEHEVAKRTQEYRAVSGSLRAESGERKRLAEIVNSSRDAIFTKTLDGIITSWNDGAHKLYGFTAEQAFGQHISMIVPQSRLEELETIFEQLRRGESISTIETVRQRKNGSFVEVSLSISPLSTDPDAPPEFSVIGRDITAEKRNERLMRTIIDGTDDAVFVKNCNLQYELINQAGASFMGRSVDEVEGKTDLELFPVDQSQRVQLEDRRILDTAVTEKFEEDVEFRDGHFVSFLTTKSPIRDVSGAVVGLFGVSRDVTTLKLREKDLAASEARLERAVMRSPFPAIIHAEDGRIVLVNQAWSTLTGYDHDDIPTIHDWTRRAYGSQAGDVRQHIEQLYALDHRLDEGEFEIQTSTGEKRIWAFWSSALGPGPDGSLWAISMAMDVTVRKQLETQMKELNNQLEKIVESRTAKLKVANQELESFSYSVSHDLRAPLRHITGFSELLARHVETDLSIKAKHYLERIITATRHAGEIVDALLAFSRMGRTSLNSTDLDLHELTTEIVNDRMSDCSTPSVVEWKIAPLPIVHADANLIRIVLSNLIENAIKYSSHRDKAIVEISASETEDEFIVNVTDNGIGFDMTYQDKLFKVFQRLHPMTEFEGLGIGLATVQRIVSRHGGRVWAIGQIDQGATFSFSLPRNPLMEE